MRARRSIFPGFGHGLLAKAVPNPAGSTTRGFLLVPHGHSLEMRKVHHPNSVFFAQAAVRMTKLEIWPGADLAP